MDQNQSEQLQILQERIIYLENLLRSQGIEFQGSEQQKQTEEKQISGVKLDMIGEGVLKYDEIERYKRQMILPEISYGGQVLISKARVLIIGVGGIGGPAAFYLAGAGVGVIGLMDGDRVEESNLHRQIIHTAGRVGMNKCDSAYEQIRQFNGLVRIERHKYNITPENAKSVVEQYDIILDATDNPMTRYLINDICVILGKPLISGSAVQWEGQLSVYNFKGPCYRCLFPECPKAVKNCSDAGVFGVLPGFIGLLEALETIKLITGHAVLSRKMVVIDGLAGRFFTAKLRDRQTLCAVCGDQPSITDIQKYDYNSFAGSCSVQIPASDKYKNINWDQLQDVTKDDQNPVLIDCRPKEQYDVIGFKNFRNVPWSDIKLMENDELKKEFPLDINKSIYIMCRRGNNSRLACDFLASKGYQNLYNIIGGINKYAKEYDQNMPLL